MRESRRGIGVLEKKGERKRPAFCAACKLRLRYSPPPPRAWRCFSVVGAKRLNRERVSAGVFSGEGAEKDEERDDGKRKSEKTLPL